MEDNKKNEPKYRLLSHIDSPADLRALSVDQLPEVCRELRADIIDELSHNPGHFASSLGTVELTVALHYVYNTPDDRIVWDVGHQAYGHKILTGRREAFSTNRQFGGLRPFPSPDESPYDTFACGHASNSISAALGMAVAARRLGNNSRHVVAVIGDGAMSGGLAFEGLNNASSTPNDMLIILNDNDMSIDQAVGGMRQYLLHLHTSNFYNRLRFKLSRFFQRHGLLPESRRKRILRFNNSLKSLIANQQNVFEGMNIRYFGPVDGHNVEELVRTLREVKEMSGPKMLHVHTVKGKGFAPAEREATVWHAPGKFDAVSGHRISEPSANTCLRFQDVFGRTLVELAHENERIVGVTPAMPTGSGMTEFFETFPDRAFDVGIAEEHAVTFSAGMAKDGLMPFCNIYSAFAQRAFDNIVHDMALLNLPVCLCLDRAGLVGQDGPTHHGAFDMAALRPIPNLTICSPYDECELRCLMFTAQLPGMGSFVIRYPRGCGYRTDWHCALQAVPIGTGRMLKDGRNVAVLSIGPIGHAAAQAIEKVEAQRPDVTIAHYDVRFLKPLDEALLLDVGRRFERILTVEDGVRAGGMGSAVLELLADHGLHPQIVRLGLPDAFVEHGSPRELYRLTGLDADGIAKALLTLMDDHSAAPTTPPINNKEER